MPVAKLLPMEIINALCTIPGSRGLLRSVWVRRIFTAQKTTLELKDVPADILKIAREKLPDVKFDTAWQMSNGTYEVRGKAKNGKVREIDITPDGTVVEIE